MLFMACINRSLGSDTEIELLAGTGSKVVSLYSRTFPEEAENSSAMCRFSNRVTRIASILTARSRSTRAVDIETVDTWQPVLDAVRCLRDDDNGTA